MEITAVHFNGGFARAAALTPRDILTDLAGADALIGAEQALLEDINARGAVFLARLVGGRTAPWRALGLDPDGLDLAAGPHAARLSFEARAADPQAWRAAFARLARERTA
jgi:heme iron utilization protein